MKVKNKVLLSILATVLIATPLIYSAISFTTSATVKQNNIAHDPNAIRCCCPGCLRGMSSKTITISPNYKDSTF
ncbi:hypothetical protein ACM0LK_02405 [Mycoplasma sp. Z331B]|uniref:hypothetical protein n=1 Tax=Mycoplasma sp. Z331B TaxID=3398775 RepID=UPI003A89D626